MPSFASCPNLTKTQYHYLHQEQQHATSVQTPICRTRSTEVLLFVCRAATSTDSASFRKLVASKNWIFETAVNSHHHDQKRNSPEITHNIKPTECNPRGWSMEAEGTVSFVTRLSVVTFRNAHRQSHRGGQRTPPPFSGGMRRQQANIWLVVPLVVLSACRNTPNTECSRKKGGNNIVPGHLVIFNK